MIIQDEMLRASIARTLQIEETDICLLYTSPSPRD